MADGFPRCAIALVQASDLRLCWLKIFLYLVYALAHNWRRPSGKRARPQQLIARPMVLCPLVCKLRKQVRQM